MFAAMRREYKIALLAAAVFVALYVLAAYFLLPSTWRHYEHQKKLATLAMVTHTKAGIPGDPINVGLVGSKEDVLCAMKAAGWYPADPTTLRSSIAIAGSVLLDRPYHDAPVSHLYYEGRREDFAFEKPVGKSADRRHHVRFWQVLESGDEDRPVWLGAVTYDRGVGFSHNDAQITHHIAPDVDAERDQLAVDLEDAKAVGSIYEVSGIGPTLNGRNGGGDTYYTDGEIKFSVLVAGCGQTVATTTELSSPPSVEAKNRLWSAIANIWRSWMGAIR
ncbi:MAG: LssY C-terminal domain-containing protein [Xanthobacteraceae bacterium]